MDIILKIVFWSSLTLIISTYFIYPLLLLVISKIWPFHVQKKDIYPSVSVIISAYNEEKHIEQKIENTLNLDYPREKLEIIIASDGSTDKTCEIAARFKEKGIKLLDFQTNRGKVIIQNESVKSASGEIILFMDAASLVDKGSLRKIVQNFSDKRVGCVAGRMVYVDTDLNITTESQGLYWKYENNIRNLESMIGQMIGVDGPLYAIRKSNYVMLEKNIISDLITPLLVILQGKKVVLEQHAIVMEEPNIHSGHEFKTRRRITLRGLNGLRSFPEMLNPFSHFSLSMQIIFHKILRWFVGPFVGLNFITSVALSGNKFYSLIFVGYCLLFLFAITGFILNKKGLQLKILTVPYYFILVNLSATMGILDFLRRKEIISWKPVRA
ncbi:MAG: glycosyltransferase family 2 protein [Calditrichaceae bacterium]